MMYFYSPWKVRKPLVFWRFQVVFFKQLKNLLAREIMGPEKVCFWAFCMALFTGNLNRINGSKYGKMCKKESLYFACFVEQVDEVWYPHTNDKSLSKGNKIIKKYVIYFFKFDVFKLCEGFFIANSQKRFFTYFSKILPLSMFSLTWINRAMCF